MRARIVLSKENSDKLLISRLREKYSIIHRIINSSREGHILKAVQN